VAEAAIGSGSRREVESLRWCLQSIITGGPTGPRTPLIAQRLIEAAQYSCTLTTFDEHKAREAWEKLLQQGVGGMVGFYEYSDGLGGSTGEGRLRFVGRYPISFLRGQFVPTVLSRSNETEREELFECLMTVFDSNKILGAEEVAIMVTNAHDICAVEEGDYGYTTQDFERVTLIVEKHNVKWGSRILEADDAIVQHVFEHDEQGRRRLLVCQSCLGPIFSTYYLHLFLLSSTFSLSS
jgi:hypothetical protein